MTRCPLEAKIARVQYHLDETDRWVPISRGGQMAINRRRLRLINELDYLETLRSAIGYREDGGVVAKMVGRDPRSGKFWAVCHRCGRRREIEPGECKPVWHKYEPPCWCGCKTADPLTDRDWQLCYGGWYEYYKEQAKDSLTSE